MSIEDALSFEQIILTVDRQKILEQMPGSNDVLWQVLELLHPTLSKLHYKGNLSFQLVEDPDLFTQNKVRLIIRAEE